MSALDEYQQKRVECARQQLARLQGLDLSTANPWKVLGSLEVTLEDLLEIVDHLSGSESPVDALEGPRG